MKKLLKRSKKAKVDFYKNLLEWRNTVTPGSNSSLMQKLMSRRARSFLPCKEEKYIPQIVSRVPENIIERKRISKLHHDKKARSLPELIVDQPVRVKIHPQLQKSPWKPGTVQSVRGPRSYEVEVDGVKYKRNRVHLRDSMVPSKPKDSQGLLQEPVIPDKPSMSLESAAKMNTAKMDAEPAASSPPTVPTHKSFITRSGRVSKPNPKYQ